MDMANIGEMFADFWWLLFPLAFFIAAGWDSHMKFKRHKATLEVLKSYAESGKEPPESLVKALRGGGMTEELGLDALGDEDDDWRDSAPFLVILMLGLAGVFAYAGHTGLLGFGEEGFFVAMILGVIGFAFFVAAIFRPRR